MKKIYIIILSLIILLSTLVTNVYADEIDTQEDEMINFEETVQTSNSIEEPQINSRSVAIFDRTAKEVIYGKNENKKVAMASTTKIMTCTVVLEKVDLNEVVEVSGKAAGVGGSRLGLKKGDKVKVIDLLYGLMLRSRK